MKFISYKTLVILWWFVGLVVLVNGEITRLEYGCIWVLLMLEYISEWMRESEGE